MRVTLPKTVAFYDNVTTGYFQLTAVVGPIFMALALVFIALSIELLGRTASTAHLWALAIASSTVILPLTRLRPLDCATAALIAALFLVALHMRHEKKSGTVALFVVLYVIGAIMRPFILLTMPLFVAFLLGYSQLPEKLRRYWVMLAAIGPLLVFALLFTLFVPQIHRAALRETFSIWSIGCRLWSLVAAPGRSLFLHSPLLVLSFLGLRALSAEDEPVGRLLKGVIALGVMVVVLFSDLPGKTAWEAEPFLAFLPFALMPIAFLDLKRRRIELCIFLVLGLAFQILALMVGPTVLAQPALDGRAVYYPDFCPLYSAFQAAYGGQVDLSYLAIQADEKTALIVGLLVITSLLLLNGAALAHHINQH